MTTPNTPPTTLQIAPSTVLTALPLRRRRALHRLLERHALRQQAVAPQKVLEVAEQLRHAIPELTGLLDERRDHHQGDGDEHRDDRQVDRQDGERPADADPLLAADPARPVGEADHRRKAHRDDGADVDQHQRRARHPHRRPDDHHRGDRAGRSEACGA